MCGRQPGGEAEAGVRPQNAETDRVGPPNPYIRESSHSDRSDALYVRGIRRRPASFGIPTRLFCSVSGKMKGSEFRVQDLEFRVKSLAARVGSAVASLISCGIRESMVV